MKIQDAKTFRAVKVYSGLEVFRSSAWSPEGFRACPRCPLIESRWSLIDGVYVGLRLRGFQGEK